MTQYDQRSYFSSFWHSPETLSPYKIQNQMGRRGVDEKSYMEKGIRRNADVQTVRQLNNKMTAEIFDGVKDFKPSMIVRRHLLGVF